MTMTLQSGEAPLAGRERLSRVLAVAATLYSLMALISAGVAALGLFGLGGLAVDPAAIEPARLLGLPWSLAATASAAPSPAWLLGLVCATMAANFCLLALAARAARIGGR